MSARAVAHVLFRHKRKILATLVLAVALAAAWQAVRPTLHRAEASLLLDGARPDAAPALAALLASRDLHVQVTAAWGQRLYPGMEGGEAVAAFGRDLSVKPAADASLVRLSLDNADGAAAAGALDALVEAVRVRNAALFSGTAEEGGDHALERRAAAAREKLAGWRKTHGVFDLEGERGGLVRRRAEMEAQATAAEAEAASAAERLALLRQRLAATPATIQLSSDSERSRVLEDARAKLFDLQAKEQELLGKYRETSPLVQNLRAERAGVERLLKGLDAPTQSRVTSGANPVHQELENEVNRTEAALSAAKARLKTLSRQMAETDRRLQALAGGEGSLAELELAVQQAEAALAARRKGASAGVVNGIGVVERAAAGRLPTGPAPAALLGGAAAAGLLLGLLWAALAQRFSRSFDTPADVERRLGLPVLSTIPRES